MALDFIAGCIGGCAGVIVGHPLDTVKVRLQTQDFANPQYKGTYHCIQKIIEKESVSGLYKGMSSPLAGIAFVNAIIFGVYGNIQRNMSDPNSMFSHLVAGCSAGFFQSFICSPMELAKTRMQLQTLDVSLRNHSAYKSPMDCLLKVKKAEGWRGIFKGMVPTVLREVPGCGIYFLSYEVFSDVIAGGANKKLTTLQMMLAGGLSGSASWVVIYPIDVVKSRMQADGMGGANARYKGMLDCLRQGMRDEGYRFLSKGLGSTVIRAFPVNAATFTTVTWVFRLCGEPSTASQYDYDVLFNLKKDMVACTVVEQEYFKKLNSNKLHFYRTFTRRDDQSVGSHPQHQPKHPRSIQGEISRWFHFPAIFSQTFINVMTVQLPTLQLNFADEFVHCAPCVGNCGEIHYNNVCYPRYVVTGEDVLSERVKAFLSEEGTRTNWRQWQDKSECTTDISTCEQSADISSVDEERHRYTR